MCLKCNPLVVNVRSIVMRDAHYKTRGETAARGEEEGMSLINNHPLIH